MIQAYAPVFGDAITETVVVPERTIRPGTETLDGVTLAYEKADAAEAGVNLVIELPENRVLIAQDLVYNRVHVFLQQKEMGPWLAHLRRFQEKEYDFVLSGHGLPANMQALADMAGYLEDARSALAASSDVPTLKQHLVGKYPLYRGRDAAGHQREVPLWDVRDPGEVLPFGGLRPWRCRSGCYSSSWIIASTASTERPEVGLDDVPENRRFRRIIGVDADIPEPGNLSPFNLRVAGGDAGGICFTASPMVINLSTTASRHIGSPANSSNVRPPA